MDFLKQLERHISNGDFERFLTECNIVSDCLGLTDHILQVSARLRLLEKKKIQGVIIYEDEVVTENNIIQSLIKLKRNIESDVVLLKKCLANKSGKIDDKILSIAELIPHIIDAIVVENQEILTKFFTGEESSNEIMQKMTSLFHKQGKRRNFTEWISILKEISLVVSKKIQTEIKYLIDNLEDLKVTLYFYDPVDLSPERIAAFEDQVRKGILGPEEIKKFHMTILDKFPPNEAKNLVLKYLDYLRGSSDNITNHCTKIKVWIQNGE